VLGYYRSEIVEVHVKVLWKLQL